MIFLVIGLSSITSTDRETALINGYLVNRLHLLELGVSEIIEMIQLIRVVNCICPHYSKLYKYTRRRDLHSIHSDFASVFPSVGIGGPEEAEPEAVPGQDKRCERVEAVGAGGGECTTGAH